MHTFWQQLFGLKQPTVTYCEQATNSIIARPGYFVSNFAYIAVGIYLLTRKRKLVKVFGLISILVGTFSAIYDASFSFYAQIFDLSAMTLFVIFLLALNLRKLESFSDSRILILSGILQALYVVAILFLEGQSGRILFGAMVLAIIITEYIYKRKNPHYSSRYFLIALAIFAIGFLIWIFDATQTICSPIDYLNGRAIYHYLTAVTIFYLYRHNSQELSRISS